MFIEIPPHFLADIATDSDRVPTLYYSRYWLLRKFFWMRLRLIYFQIKRDKEPKTSCLDFGGGGGVFLPTLSKYFKSVVCVDLEDSEARKVVEKYNLQNVKLLREDIANIKLSDAPFDTIIAADVLEHFQDLSVPVAAFRNWLRKGGTLYTSLPTENYIYVFLRKIFKITKPWDHYHTGYEVEAYLKNSGFKKIQWAYVPFYLGVFPLFLVSTWKLDETL